MAWTGSGVFAQYLVSTLGTRLTGDLGLVSANEHRVALFNDSITPDKDATAANARYGAGAWASGGVSDSSGNGNWDLVGRVMAGKGVTTPVAGKVRFSATNTGGGGTLTITNAFGALIYNDSVAQAGPPNVSDQGVCFNYFGGAQSVTGGTFTIIWSANGIFEITV